MIQELIDEMSLTVSQLNDYVAELFDADELLSGVLVTGEISNFKLHSSGHMYFTLKDENASIRCVMFRQYAGGIGFLPKDGMKVRVGGGYRSIRRKDSTSSMRRPWINKEKARSIWRLNS